MVEAAPAASLVVSKTQFLFELLVVAFDPPAQLGQIDQAVEGHVRRDGGQPILGGFGIALGPFDQQSFLLPRRGPPLVAMGGPHPTEPEQNARSALPRFPRARRSSASLPRVARAQ